MIPQETVNAILDAVRIEEVIGDFVTLRRRGASLVACCPFHNEKTPSFHVTPARSMYYCFGCHKGGSAVTFLMEHEHMTYPDALRYLAKKYHIEIQETELTPEEIQARQKGESLMLVTEFAQKFFTDSLRTQEGRAYGGAYYKSRGLEDGTIETFGLGWAPSGRTALADAARAAGYREEYLVETGLCIKYDDGRLVDRFSERVTFPIHSVSGRVIAFSARTLSSDKKVAKYVNSSDSEIYHKKQSLYGIFLAKSEIARQDRCILVEGNVDVVSMHQLGITNVVASCGTALTIEQIRLIHKFTDNVTIMYDGDGAGIHAAQRGIDLVLKEGLNVKVVLLPDGDDPDSYSRKHTLEEVRDFISTHEQDFIEFETDLLLGQAGGDPIKKANLINDISDTVALIPDEIKRSVYTDTVARSFQVERDIIARRVARTHGKLMEDSRKERAREEEVPAPVPQEAPAAPSAGTEQTVQSQIDAQKAQFRIVAPVEADILHFLLMHGTDILEFESDSEMHAESDEDRQTVADFILGSIDEDGGTLVVPAYQAVYDAYASAYDEGLSQGDIIRRLISSQDSRVSYLTAELCMEKYQLTVSSFEKSLTTVSSWLTIYVPKTMLLYMEKKLEYQYDQLRRKLAGESDPESQIALMSQMKECQDTIKLVKAKTLR